MNVKNRKVGIKDTIMIDLNYAKLLAVPALETATLTNGTLNLTWSTEPGGMYQPQFSSDLGSSNWTSLGSPVTAAGTTLGATDSVTNGPRRFYRVVLSP